MNLSDKIVIVSGGTRGIGKALVCAFAKAGAKVAFTYAKSDDRAEGIKKELGENVIAFKADVRSLEDMKMVVEETKKQFGKLDIVINNAGITKDKALMLMEEEEWKDVIDTNLTGTFNLTRASIVTLLKQKSGSIINITSVAGRVGMARQTNYSASKAGIIGFTKALAKEVGPYGVRVNAIAPGYTETDMISSLNEEFMENAKEMIPLKRVADPSEIAKAALFLATDESKYITGEIITVDGGLVTS